MMTDVMLLDTANNTAAGWRIEMNDQQVSWSENMCCDRHGKPQSYTHKQNRETEGLIDRIYLKTEIHL